MLNVDFGLQSKNFQINKDFMAQSPSAARVGYDCVGTHYYVSFAPNAQTQDAWDRQMDNIMASLRAVANKTASYSRWMVSSYLQFCAYIDIALAEAKRDMAMVMFEDKRAMRAKLDYWGPLYESVIMDATQNGPANWSRWNTLARVMAETYPHLDMPYFNQVKEMVATIYTDDSKDRWNYIYFHHYNDTLDPVESGTTGEPSAIQALIDAETGLAAYAAAIAAGDDSDPTSFSMDKLAQIKADLLNAFGSKCNHNYGYVLDYGFTIKPTFDPDLIAVINNSTPLPTRYRKTNILEYKLTYSDDQTDLTTVAAFATTAAVGDNLIGSQPAYTISDTTSATITTNFNAMAKAYNEILSVPLRLVGPEFSGARGLMNTLFIYDWVATSAEIVPGTTTVTVAISSPYGICINRPWVNRVNTSGAPIATGEWLPTGIIFDRTIPVTDTTDMYITYGELKGLATIELCDSGNYAAYTKDATGGGYCVHFLSEPVDEAALISRQSLDVYRVGAIGGLFDINVTKFRTTRTAEYVAENNAAYVKMSGNSSDRNAGEGNSRRGKRYGKRTQKK